MASLRLVALLLAFSGALQGAPSRGDEVSVPLPNGDPVSLYVWGDEFYLRAETSEGYTVLRDPKSGEVRFAVPGSNGEMRPGPEAFTGRNPAPSRAINPGLFAARQAQGGKGLDHAPGVLKKLRRQNYDELYPPDRPGPSVAPAAGGPDEMAPVTYRAVTGTVMGLTLIVDFSDVTGTVAPAEINDYCNLVGYTGFSNNGSVRDYYYEVSSGKLTYLNHVPTFYYRAANPKTYYVDPAIAGFTRAKELVLEALQALEASGFNFATLSLTEFNMVMAVNLLYAGNADSAWAKGLWPHSGWLPSAYNVDGVFAMRYQMAPIGSALRLGAFCHENGHMLFSWPDLYDTNGGSWGLGDYCLMAYVNGINPQPPNPFYREMAGWETPIDVTGQNAGQVYSSGANSYESYVWHNPASATSERYQWEVRRKTGRSTAIKDEGLLVYHVDEAGSNSLEQATAAQHYRVALVQADGNMDMELDVNYGDATDAFDSAVNRLTDGTTPSARWWDGSASGLDLNSITGPGNEVSFQLGGVPATASPTYTATATRTASPTRTVTSTRTISPTRTATPTRTASATPSPLVSATATATPGAGLTDTATPTPSGTATGTSSVTAGSSSTFTLTLSATPAAFGTPTATGSATPAVGPTSLPTNSLTATPTATDGPSTTPSFSATTTVPTTASPTATPSYTRTRTGTPSASPTGTATLSVSASATASPALTPTATQTGTPTASRTGTPPATLSPTPSSTAAVWTATATLTPSATPAPSTTPEDSVDGALKIGEVVVHPNPVRGGQAQIRFRLMGAAQGLRWRVYSPAMTLLASGESERELPTGWNSETLDLAGLRAGPCYVVLEAGRDTGARTRSKPLVLYYLGR